MPRGGNHGGGRPKLEPLEMAKVTAAYSLNPVVKKTVSDIAKYRGISASELVEQILIEYFEE